MVNKIPALFLPKRGVNEQKPAVKPKEKKVPKKEQEQQNNKKYAALLQV